MPISRKRRPRPSRRPTADRRRRPGRAGGGQVIESVALRDLLLSEPDAHDVECMTRSLEAGARGDLRASLEHELDGSVILQSPSRFILQDLIDQGDSAPGWAWSRWALDLAYRSMLVAADPRTDLAVRQVMATLYHSSLLGDLDDSTEVIAPQLDETEFKLLGTQIAATDHAAADVALFELGGLKDYVEKVAGPGLLDRADRLRKWADARVGAYALVDLRGCALVLRDLVDGREVAALNIGAMCSGADDAFVGRLVPISCEPGLMFARRPMSVDLVTAQSVADAIRGDGSPPEEFVDWLWGLSSAQFHTGLPEGFHRTPTTPYTSDLPMPEIVVEETEHAGERTRRITWRSERKVWNAGDDEGEAAGNGGRADREVPGRIAELRSRGHSELVADSLGVLEIGLIAAGVSDTAAAAVSPHVVAALAAPDVFCAAETECTGAGTADAWRVLAAVVPEHVAGRCRALAALADQRSLTSDR